MSVIIENDSAGTEKIGWSDVFDIALSWRLLIN